jgi:LPS sulfotransferase NodH
MKRKIIEQFSSVLNRWTVYYENDGIKKIIEVDENLARDKYINLTDTNKILYHDGKVINETGTVEEIQKLTAEAVKEYK